MELQPIAQLRIVVTAGQLVERIRPERVKAAERAQPVRVLRDLLRRPVVLGLDVIVFVVDCCPACLTPGVRDRQDQRAPNACGVEESNDIARADARRTRIACNQRGGVRTE